MNKKNLKKIAKKNISIFEIFILVASILAFSYFVGNEFRFVGAFDAATVAPNPAETSAGTATYAGSLSAEQMIARASAAGAATTGEGVAAGTTLPPYLTPGAAGKLYPSASVATLPTDAGKGLAGSGNLVDQGYPGSLSGSAGETLPETPTGTFWSRVTASKGTLIWNAVIAVGIYAAFRFLGPLLGMNPDVAKALGTYLGIGYAAGSLIPFIFGKALAVKFGTAALWGLAGVGVSFIAFLIFYKQNKIYAIQFSCNPWQPATGGGPNGKDDCQICNKGDLPCTKYKCESLGLSCELLNEGKSTELCVWNNRNDREPPIISSWQEALPDGYTYTPDPARLPPDKGVIITGVKSSDNPKGCVPPLTRLTYGIMLDKPGMCRVDTNRTNNFSSMNYIIDQGYYMYNHTLLSFAAGLEQNGSGGIPISIGGTYETYVRCQSKNGYSNVGTFVFKYCVSDQQDITAPKIELVNPLNDMPVQKGSTSKLVDVYTDKPSDCRWSHSDESYKDMAGTMNCAQSFTEIGTNANMLYLCSANLTGLKDSTDNVFYFRCKSSLTDKSSGTNPTSYKYTLIGTQELVIDSISPKEGDLIKDAAQSVKVTLAVKTSAGYKDGEATCSYKETDSTGTAPLFANTNSYQSTQDLWLDTGSYDYTIKCCDLGGNCKTETTSFDVETDSVAPSVIRMYNDVNQLKIITDEEAECVYDTTSCSYDFADGLAMTTTDKKEHSTEWDINSVFYIKCRDSFGNMPSPDECSLIARPISSY
jgi:hypothetical protein